MLSDDEATASLLARSWDSDPGIRRNPLPRQAPGSLHLPDVERAAGHRILEHDGLMERSRGSTQFGTSAGMEECGCDGVPGCRRVSGGRTEEPVRRLVSNEGGRKASAGLLI